MLHQCILGIYFLGVLGNLIEKSHMMGTKNRYTFAMNDYTILVTPLKLVVYVDQIRIARECKLREEQLSIQEKGEKDKMSENKQKKVKNKRECGVFTSSKCIGSHK